MKSKFFLVVCFLFTLPLLSLAQDETEKHPIDIALDKCMDKNPYNQVIVGCID